MIIETYETYERLHESQLLLVLALHESDKHLYSEATPAREKEFYIDFVGRLKAAITANAKVLVNSGGAQHTLVDFEYKETPEMVFITPLHDAALSFLKQLLPYNTPPELAKAASFSRFLGAEIAQKIANAGLRLRAA